MLTVVRKIAGTLFFLGLLAGCVPIEGDNRHLQPLSQLTQARLRQIDSTPGAKMVVRIFKQESTLEVWKKTRSGAYTLFKKYEICSWSGELGPKIREGDRQSPEGFYTITPGRMNPKSSYYLSFDTGYPNKFDRAYGRTGSNLMVHGDCTSRGCYAMTDDQITEIYSLGRESFVGGQRAFELQIFPFRMTTANMARHQGSPNFEFWRNIKVGYDIFEISKQPPRWDVCGRRYVFNSTATSGRPLNATAACPALRTDGTLVAQLDEIARSDSASYATAAADAEAEAAKRVADAQAAAEASADAEARGAAINEAVSGFFSNLFGGDDTPSTASSPTPPALVPIPYPRLPR